MNNSTIIYGLINYATLTASAGSDSGHPLTNLQDGRYYTQWQSGDNSQNQTLIVLFGSARDVNYLFFANHNLASLGLDGITIESSNDGVTWNSWASASGPYVDPFYFPISLRNLLGVRLTFAKDTALSAAVQIGMIFIGYQVTLPLYLNLPKRGLKIDLVRDEALSGLRYVASTAPERQTWELNYGSFKQPQIAQIFNWLRTVGVGLHPFWFQDMDENWHFLRCDNDAFGSAGKGNLFFDLKSLQMSEERVGIGMTIPGGYLV